MNSNDSLIPLRILLVEDNTHDAMAFRRAFKKSQVANEITHCMRAEEAMEQLASEHGAAPFDLIVTDHKLPGMNGLEFCLALLKGKISVPLVLLTGSGSEHLAVEALKAGVNDYLIKDPGRGYLNLLPVVFPEVVRQYEDRLARRRAEDALRRRHRELALLNQVGQQLTATLDLHQVARQLLQATTAVISVEGALLWLWEDEDGEEDKEQEDWLVCRAAFRRDQGRSLDDVRLRPGQGIAGWVAQNDKSITIASVSDDVRFSPVVDEQTGFCSTSLLAVPLRVRDTVVGVLEVVNKQDGDFDHDDRALVETLAASAAIAIDNARLVETLRQNTVILEARNEELGAFAHTVAHDLKNPLNLVIGYAKVFDDYDTTLDKDSRNYLHIIKHSGYKMISIINALLLLAGVREMKEEVTQLDMAHITAEALQRLTLMIDEYQAEIILPGSWPEALGYGPWIEEVWTNYLSNAIKYGGHPPRVELGATEQFDQATKQPMVRFWVRDNGSGISTGAQGRLFTPFTRLDQVSVKGHGLGLSIVRRIVEKLDGKVDVESQEGRGSTFAFTLPGVS